MDEALLEEIRLMLEDKMKEWENHPHPTTKTLTFNEYVALPSDQQMRIDIEVSFDMGWQKKGL
eukprot:6204099-Ditylum_brightwellii.AAC.1